MARLTAEKYNTISGDKGEWIGVLPRNCDTKTMWSCWKCGNTFLMHYDNVKHKKWCYECRKKRTEKLVRQHFEQRFQKLFRYLKTIITINLILIVSNLSQP
jgi:hypothetical protein